MREGHACYRKTYGEFNQLIEVGFNVGIELKVCEMSENMRAGREHHTTTEH